jgi:hypothetical protein
MEKGGQSYAERARRRPELELSPLGSFTVFRTGLSHRKSHAIPMSGFAQSSLETKLAYKEKPRLVGAGL